MAWEIVLAVATMALAVAAAVRLMLLAQQLTARESELAAEHMELEAWERDLIVAAEGRGCAACRLRVCKDCTSH
ncbi:hypothetical protein I4I73_13870 [Pseudonocardia sp. KRD-184]|uniref:Secreted protein n=1 Tax=Pseudonocardia oceani TaxID=2792013 RepID=A0ABS6U8U1_9PSEU|nr:hypothetical protein [Pseudonocardia oceani]MBW0090024.1 hypothetical protein [Pseudonocardia oceani]MBW0097076.1 hypothetical protein [Pseudonocardia oceani]MBW0109811.1 hypothetical protein [Pseudonocardia oceani]MBW0123913.1 hypothetical protein [Pseudonocardia oceani]MBW0128652.1 hypothetical protein [Pseudonocardia oceani]